MPAAAKVGNGKGRYEWQCLGSLVCMGRSTYTLCSMPVSTTLREG